jgi:2,4-dienoyl-CoA reductase-like NADH-dependent reductase (Old Yellow Enzyme family)
VRWRKELADDVHEEGAAMMIQITHLGRCASWSKDDWLPVIAPSHVREPPCHAFPKSIEDWDIARVIVAYADAAERMKPGGLDGVEFECYGHLIDQFCRRPPTSARTNMAGQWKTACVSASRCSTR